MANFDNLSVKILEEEMIQRGLDGFKDGYVEMFKLFEKGLLDGSEDAGKLFPEFYRKPFFMMGPYERGYMIGREWAIWEKRYEVLEGGG